MFEKSTADTQPNEDAHRCIAGPACRAAERVDGQRVAMLTATPNTLCEPCRAHIADACRRLPSDWTDLRRALGDRQGGTVDKVRSTPTPVIPISTAREALMGAIVELTDRAAAIVSDGLHTDHPDGRRRPPPPITVIDEDGAPRQQIPADGSAAACADELSNPDDWRRLTAAVALVEPHIDLLTAAPSAPALVWRGPRRCDTHDAAISAAEYQLDVTPKDDLDAARDALRLAYASAAKCDDCNGWDQRPDPRRGQSREWIEESGLDLALGITELHNRVRADLGKTRLRHRYAMPCPRCGHRVGRDDGAAVVDCENQACGSSWTEREYKFLAGLIVDEGREMDILKWLLAEANWRLDALRVGADKIRDDPALEAPGSGTYVLEGIDIILDGHPKPTDRTVGTDRPSTEERQAGEDNWAWRNETAYRPPRKRTRTVKPPYEGPRYTESSRSTLVEVTDLPERIDRSKVCRSCNMIHAGDCIA